MIQDSTQSCMDRHKNTLTWLILAWTFCWCFFPFSWYSLLCNFRTKGKLSVCPQTRSPTAQQCNFLFVLNKTKTQHPLLVLRLSVLTADNREGDSSFRFHFEKTLQCTNRLVVSNPTTAKFAKVLRLGLPVVCPVMTRFRYKCEMEQWNRFQQLGDNSSQVFFFFLQPALAVRCNITHWIACSRNGQTFGETLVLLLLTRRAGLLFFNLTTCKCQRVRRLP